jgi:hypothetical protein
MAVMSEANVGPLGHAETAAVSRRSEMRVDSGRSYFPSTSSVSSVSRPSWRSLVLVGMLVAALVAVVWGLWRHFA